MEISTSFLVLVPLVLGVTQVIKMTVGLGKRYTPIVSLVLGMGGAVLIGAFDSTSLVQGIIVGLSASGLWSSTKATISE